jgi:protein phosphatase
MGGHRSGEVASELAVRTIRDFYDTSVDNAEMRELFKHRAPSWPFKRRPPEHPEERRIVQAVLLANEVVHSHAVSHEECKGMGTTLVGAYFLENSMYLIHIGDSRAYRLRGSQFERITRDHSLADEYIAMGILKEDELQHFPYKNVITRALGLNASVEPDVRSLPLRAGDTYLFCSDGLPDPVADEEMRAILLRHGDDLELACRELIDTANAHGGPDNVTVVLAKTFE